MSTKVSKRNVQQKKKNGGAIPGTFVSMLPPWDLKVPESPEELVRATSKYYGHEAIPGKPGWIQDFVFMGPEGVDRVLPRSLAVPERYWVVLSMLDWSITVYQHIQARMGDLAEATSNKKRKKECVDWGKYCLERVWWYIRCRDFIKADVKLPKKAKPPQEIVASLNELIWREVNNLVDKDVPNNMASGGNTAQTLTLAELCDMDGDTFGMSPYINPYLQCLLPWQRRAGAQTTISLHSYGLIESGLTRNQRYPMDLLPGGGAASM